MIALASDHAGYEYKENLKKLLDGMKLPYRDFGAQSKDSTDYPDWGHKAAQAVSTGECDRGILVCGTGIGMSIVANKHKGVRAALCSSATAARLARQHNDANVLTLGAGLIGENLAMQIIDTWLKAEFLGGRHAHRVDKIVAIDKQYLKSEK